MSIKVSLSHKVTLQLSVFTCILFFLRVFHRKLSQSLQARTVGFSARNGVIANHFTVL